MKKIFCLVFMLFISVALFAQSVPTEKTASPGTSPVGFGPVNWGSSLETVKPLVKGKLSYSDEKNILISKDENIIYKYGFLDSNAENKNISELYYVLLGFPYLSLTDIKDKLVSVYGEPTIEDVKKNKGAIIWDSKETIIVIWVDEYENEPFCRKISYLGKTLAKKADNLVNASFSAKERDILKRLNVQ